MDTGIWVEWGVGAVFVGVNAYRRYNTPSSNRESTTFHNFVTYFIFYLVSILALYVFCGALLDSSPETVGAIYGLLSGQPNASLPGGLSEFSAPMVSALFLTTLLPSLPFLSRYDKALLNTFWDRGHIPYHAQRMAAAMRRTPFKFSPRQIKQLRARCRAAYFELEDLRLDGTSNFDFRWARINVLLDGIEDWQQIENYRLRRFVLQHEEALALLNHQRDEINNEFLELRTEQLEDHIREKMERFLSKSMTTLFRDATIFIAKATCSAELSESGRRSRVSQLGFEGGTPRLESLSGRQIASALTAILLTFLALSIVQELGEDRQDRRFGSVLFMTFLMFFTYGATLVIALDLKRRTGMGYNELTRQRSWSGYVMVGVITALSWFLVSFSYRYSIQMLSGWDSLSNFERAAVDISWSSPYALQSLALAMSLSWILDFHQSRGTSTRLTLQQRVIAVGVSMTVLGLASLIACLWMEGIGWFEGYATREEAYRQKSPLPMGWMVVKGMAVAAIVGWLVPMWFRINRTKAPDQIAGRAIMMNRTELSKEIQQLQPDELVRAVAAVSASVAVIGLDVSRDEKSVYQIICSQLAGLGSSDVDIDSAEMEFDRCLALIKDGKLDLEARLKKFNGLPLLSALMPLIASSVAFADGIYLDQERQLVDKLKRQILPPQAVPD